MDFIKKNTGALTKMIVNQIGLIIFSAVINTTISTMGEELQDNMSVVASFFAVAFYMFLIFYAMREIGNTDSVKIESGRMEYDSLFGLKIGFLSAVPNYLFSFLMLIGLLFIQTGFGSTLYSIGGIACLLVLQPMYSGIIAFLLRVLSPASTQLFTAVCYLLTPALAPVAAWLGYRYGCTHPVARKPKN